ncbi:bifunctional aminoglycoside phosphotransferase/ATP-binding protein [Pelomicrobium sp.]|uniref:bifunctional aminoglycoside phosphotransferase/ATP-binding protein n=1 Tax=Pelomicrobium sp. TaxID=2815319 RepID=UPI002FDD181D
MAAARDVLRRQRLLVQALLRPAAFPHPASDLQLLETHISFVILSGPYAYKIKKPLNLGFLDFSTLARRRHYCEEELRLNRRLAPELYLEVVAVRGDARAPAFFGEGPVLEYAVKMRRFDQQTLLDRVASREGLADEWGERLAVQVAAFHREVAVAAEGGPHGTPAAVMAPAAENFAQLLVLCPEPALKARLEALRAWTEAEAARLLPAFRQRLAAGAVRECHGDLHLGNMALVEGNIVIFDCIEFDPGLRWIDVVNEAAFLVMDLHHRGQARVARYFLNRYLEETGDYGGVSLLRFYLVYRALVRAKIAAIRARQPGLGDEGRAAQREECAAYVALAERFCRQEERLLILTCGVSASGKSRFTRRLLPLIDAIRVRTDVERKRLAGLEPTSRSGSGLETDLYTPQITRHVYEHVAQLCLAIAQAGWIAIADGTFLKRWQRSLVTDAARTAGLRCVVLEFNAAEELLRERVRRRLARGIDVSEADERVLERQLAQREALHDKEADQVLRFDTGKQPDPDPQEVLARIRA